MMELQRLLAGSLSEPIVNQGTVSPENQRFAGIAEKLALKEDERILGAISYARGLKIALIGVNTNNQLSIHSLGRNELPNAAANELNKSERTLSLNSFDTLNFYQTPSPHLSINLNTAGQGPETTFYGINLTDASLVQQTPSDPAPKLTVNESSIVNALAYGGKKGGILYLKGEGQPTSIGMVLESTKSGQKTGNVIFFYNDRPSDEDLSSPSSTGVILSSFLDNLSKQWENRILNNPINQKHNSIIQTLEATKFDTLSTLNANLLKAMALAKVLTEDKSLLKDVNNLLYKGFLKFSRKIVGAADVTSSIAQMAYSDAPSPENIALPNNLQLLTEQARTLRRAYEESGDFGLPKDVSFTYVLNILKLARKKDFTPNRQINKLNDVITLLTELQGTVFAKRPLHYIEKEGKITLTGLHDNYHCHISDIGTRSCWQAYRPAEQLLEIKIQRFKADILDIQSL